MAQNINAQNELAYILTNFAKGIVAIAHEGKFKEQKISFWKVMDDTVSFCASHASPALKEELTNFMVRCAQRFDVEHWSMEITLTNEGHARVKLGGEYDITLTVNSEFASRCDLANAYIEMALEGECVVERNKEYLALLDMFREMFATQNQFFPLMAA